ncbi:MAG: DUF3379 family protein [Pseudomonadota bacterium]
MNAGSPECVHTRLQIGGDPHDLPPGVTAHLATCAACRQFLEETLLLDRRLRSALELPLANFRTRPVAAPARRYALAASVALAMLLAGGFWAFRPQSALAGEVVAHVLEEGSSWNGQTLLPPAEVAGVLRTAGVQLDASLPVIYAYPCPFRGHRVAHLVVQTGGGPVTVMLLVHEKVSKRTQFAESGLHGVLLPARTGSVAVLARDGAQVPEVLVARVVSAIR